MSHPLPAGARRLVSKASRRPRGEVASPTPEYPSNSRNFVHLDARLLPYWHTLFDICPALLKLDPPEGLNMFRSFMTWAYRHQPPLDWTYHVNVCRWLLGSEYAAQIDEEPIEAFMAAAAARWIGADAGQAQGVVLAWRGVRVCDWKAAARVPAEPPAAPPSAWDFAWRPLLERAAFSGWLPVP